MAVKITSITAQFEIGPVLSDAIEATMDELTAACMKFPTWPSDPLHALAVLGEEFGELTKAVLQAVYEPHKSNPAHVRAEAIQTAAMALRFLVGLDHYEYLRGEQHGQSIKISGGQQ